MAAAVVADGAQAVQATPDKHATESIVNRM